MIILIPLGGTGERFKNEGFNTPKSLINVDNKPIIFHLLDNLHIHNNIEYVYIPYNKEYVEYDFENMIHKQYPFTQFKFLQLSENTRGAADTIRIALDNIKKDTIDCPILCIDSDNFYTTDIIKLWKGENKVFTFNDKLDNPRYSYINTTNGTTLINRIIEKTKISDYACCGAYGFSSWKQLLQYANYIIENNIMQKNEYYTSTIIQSMINDNINIHCEVIQNKHYYSLGTPEQINEYEHPFLFDLDGTLVNTDHIYTSVWKYIFNKYDFDFDINKHFFDNFIKGKNDSLFLQYLFPNIDKSLIDEISILKDNLFIEYLKKDNASILLPGVCEFFEKNKNKKIGIVTSCNNQSAEYILGYTGLNEYISILIAASDCTKHKPDPEPYLNAISILGLNPNKTIIFEDSYSGYTSALNADVYKIIIIQNEESCVDIQNANEYKIIDYTNFDINQINEWSNKKNEDKPTISREIKTKLMKTLPISDVIYNDIQLKTGYICDIQSYRLVFNDNSTQNIVLKINNCNNNLSKTAEKMNLYNNEINFYTNISCHIDNDILHIPKSYGTIDIDKDRKGIILENLLKYEGEFNIDLNNNIPILLEVVSHVANMHKKYYFKSKEDVPLNMSNVNTMDQVLFFKELLKERYPTFIQKNKTVLKENEIDILNHYFQKYDENSKQTSTYPLSFCHGDMKTANIFYKQSKTPYFLDWQYIQLNKGVSDICFLLVESIKYDKIKVDLVLKYYYCIIRNGMNHYTYDEFINDFKISLGVFPLIVCVWFNSEDSDKLIDNVFPIKFMKNMLEYMKLVNAL